ncbi:MAG: type II toxin-antitoxin system VapC family toxin [Micromonosporaceae bacterium]
MGEIGAAVASESIEPAPAAVVVDASALIFATTDDVPHARGLRKRLGRDTCHAPHLIDAELGNVLRRMAHRGEMSRAHAEAVLHTAPALVDLRHDHRGALAAAAWRLRDNVTFYDGLYVALAAALNVVLLTDDKRLASAPNLPCAVESVR